MTIDKKYKRPSRITDNNFQPTAPLETAVLFLVFNRPDTTERVFNEIRKAKPNKLYVASDGPRINHELDINKNNEVKNIVTKIDWPCELKTLFRDSNLGCKEAVRGAITWFFKFEEQGIILEDDCLPSQSFFYYCQELLVKYKHSQSIGMISGNNFYTQNPKNDHSYGYSIHGGIWGWATWSSVWSDCISQADILSEKNVEKLRIVLKNNEQFKILLKQVREINANELDSWAIQFAYTRYINNLLCIRPAVTLVSNIGLGHDEAVNTKGDSGYYSSFYKTNDLKIPLLNPPKIVVDIKADNHLQKMQYEVSFIYRFIRILGRIKPFINKIFLNVKC
jgi:hypothetical protein